MRSNTLLHPIAAWRQHEQTSEAAANGGIAARRNGSRRERVWASSADIAVRRNRRRRERTSTTPPVDTAVRRTRDAGGPVDEACYPCSCGCFFIAPVSTTVTCPHCGTTQAW